MIQCHLSLLSGNGSSESVDKQVTFYRFHSIVSGNLFVNLRDDLFLYLLADLQTGSVGNSLFSLFAVHVRIETLQEVGHVAHVHSHSVGQIVFQSVAVGQSDGIAEGIH